MRGISASVLAKHLLYAQQSDLLDRPLWASLATLWPVSGVARLAHACRLRASLRKLRARLDESF
jgi:hypothetical protein